MSNENKSIHEFDFELICKYYSNIERQGPGSLESTLKALSFIDNLTSESKIIDLGCGTGGQTITLAQHAQGNIIGMDLSPIFIERLNSNASKLNLSHKVTGEVGSMDKLNFKEEEFDLIWSEGAIYNIGFERGLKEWHKFLKPNGYIAVTEAAWFTNTRPNEIYDFWKNEYPGIDTIPNQIKQLQNAGYMAVASFILPEYCWTDNYYIPQIPIQQFFLEKYKNNKAAMELVENQKHEAELYAKFKQYYGYVFYIGRKI